uniref:Sushi domain-containing protein n=1 Tax=Panagrolaimus sp. ES5 TaxID=591445 RepID=A0AC34F9M3_9BILA
MQSTLLIPFLFIIYVNCQTTIPRPKRQSTNLCPAIPAPINGEIKYSSETPSLGSGYSSGTQATLTCLGGDYSGAKNTTCNNGIWIPLIGSCPGTGIPADSSSAPCLLGPVTPLNGQLKYSTGSVLGPWPAGSTVQLACNPGYTPSGILQATCINRAFNSTMLGECNLSPAKILFKSL